MSASTSATFATTPLLVVLESLHLYVRRYVKRPIRFAPERGTLFQLSSVDPRSIQLLLTASSSKPAGVVSLCVIRSFASSNCGSMEMPGHVLSSNPWKFRHSCYTCMIVCGRLTSGGGDVTIDVS